jgi:dCMP deaminase
MNWDEDHMDSAHRRAKKSKDSTKVGCAIFGPDHEMLSEGFNGPPIGVKELPERRERPTKYLYTCHAEENAVALAARSGHRLKGGTAYVTHHPCSRCARSLIQAGIVRVVFDDGKTSMPLEEFAAAHEMLSEAGVAVTPFSSNPFHSANLSRIA